MVVNVPFGFTVGQKAYPAGKYVVTACDPSTSSTMYRLSTLGGNNTIEISTGTVQSPNRIHPPSLLFASLGGEYALMQIWTGRQWGAELSTSGFKNRVIADGETRSARNSIWFSNASALSGHPYRRQSWGAAAGL
jgi:hypothetical protein